MADLVIADNTLIRRVDALSSQVDFFTLAVDFTAGQLGAIDSNGEAVLADADAAGAQQVRFLALSGGSAGQTISGLEKGGIAGFTISQAYDASLFVSNTAGAIADAAGTLEVKCGIVKSRNDASKTKYVWFDADLRGDQ